MYKEVDSLAIKLKRKLQQQGLRGLALDIDQTLADSSVHYFEHMVRFHMPDGITRDELFLKFRELPLGSIEGWNTSEARHHFEIALRSGEFQEEISLIPDVHSHVIKLSKIKPILAYITARPEDIHEATDRWLKKHNFPTATLLTQPEEYFNPLTAQSSWKAKTLKFLYPQILGIVDDNVLLAHELQRINYKGTLYLYSKESDRVEFKNMPHVVICPTWPDVVKKVTSK